MADWTRDMDARLAEDWILVLPNGRYAYSSARIAERMGMTKNSIVGRAHRLNLPRRPSPINLKGGTPKPLVRPKHTLQEPTGATGWRVPKKTTVTPKMLMGRAAAKLTLPVTTEESRPVAVVAMLPKKPAAPPVHRKCQFPLWSGKPTHLYCSAPTVPRSDGSRSSWCATHYAVCHTTHAAYGYAAPEKAEAA